MDNGTTTDMEQADFGFHNDYETAMINGDILVLSNYHILPRAGGWNDQLETDAADLLTYLRGLAWARNLKGNEDGKETEPTFEEIDGAQDTGQPLGGGGNWQTIL